MSLSLLYGLVFTSIHNYWKNHRFDLWACVHKVMSLLFNTLSRFVKEKAMATHSSTLAWKIPWAEEPGRLQTMGSHKNQTRLSNFTFTFHFDALQKEMATYSSVLAWSS